jgi:hypothetical protein
VNEDIAKEMRERYPEVPPRLLEDLGYLRHPEQPRYTRQEIRAMIDAALPVLEERKKELAKDLSRSHHGYDL